MRKFILVLRYVIPASCVVIVYLLWQFGYIGYLLHIDDNINFRKYDIYRERAESMALNDLESKFKVGSDVSTFLNVMDSYDIKCVFVTSDHGGKSIKPFYFCKSNYREPGIRSWYVTVEWRIGVHIDDTGRHISQIVVGRSLSAP